MVLEILVNPKKVTGRPWEMFFIGLMYTFVGIAIGSWLFPSYASLVMVSFTTIAAIPFVHTALASQQTKETHLHGFWLFAEYGKLLSVLTFLFIGFVTAFFLSFLFLPQDQAVSLFSAQVLAIEDVQSFTTGHFSAVFSSFFKILLNNIKVMVFCLLFSLLYGAGAIFILSWNASVMGAAIGDAMRRGLEAAVGSVFHVVSSSLAGYFVHGLPEIVAYFASAVAGSMISTSLIHDGIHSPLFEKITRHAANLAAFALLLLLFAALIEVFISPELLRL